MFCKNGVTLPRRFSSTPSIRPDPVSYTISSPCPSSLSFQLRPRPAFGPLKSTLNDTIALSLEQPACFYELLGIPETGTQLEIKQAYKHLARKYHPDVSPPDQVQENTRRFIRVQEAYETLSDPMRRALYDQDMAEGLHLAFSARSRHKFDEQTEEKNEWKSNWQSQLSELKRRSMYKRSSDDMSWGTRMRGQRDESSS